MFKIVQKQIKIAEKNKLFRRNGKLRTNKNEHFETQNHWTFWSSCKVQKYG